MVTDPATTNEDTPLPPFRGVSMVCGTGGTIGADDIASHDLFFPMPFNDDVFVVAIIRTFFPPARTRQLLVRRREFVGNVLAALLGIVTPFCSCSSIPLFIGFLEAGIPLGVTFSFFISAPTVNEVAR